MIHKNSHSLIQILLISTTSISFLFFLWGINSWKFSFVGDEWTFYIYAKHLITAPFLFNPLSFNGVELTHSPMASIYQAFFMNLFGINNFAWRLSNVILIFPLSFFFYRWIKLSFTKEVAVLATILMQCSFYLANFFKIGYDNPQSLTLFIICLYLATLFGKNPTKKLGFLLGGVLGVSFYIYFGSAFPLFIWPYFLPLAKRFHKSDTQRAIIVLFCTYIGFLFPLLFQLDSLKVVFHALGHSNAFYIKSTVWHDFLLFYKNNDYFYDHFVVGPYLDRLSQVFCIIGTITVLLQIKRSPYFLFLLSYIFVVVFIGSTSPDWSPITRGIFLLPYGFTFAGIGLNLLRENIPNNVTSFMFCWIIILIIATLNVYQSQIGVFADKNAGYTGMALIMRSFEQAKKDHKNVLLIISPSMNINAYTWTLPYMTQAYNLDDVSYRIIQPNELHCPKKTSNILLLQQDREARNRLKQLFCAKQTTYTILSPNIPFF